MALHGNFLYQISPTSVKKYRKYGYKCIYTHKLSTTITELISTNPTLAEQLSKTLLYQTSQKSDNLSADTRSQTNVVST